MAGRSTIVGLDIGRYAVKAAWVDARGVTRVETLRLPSDRFDNSGIIRPWIEKTGIHNHPCVLGLPGNQAMFQPLTLPAEDLRTFQQVCAMEIVKYNEMASETMIHGYAPILVAPPERRLLLAMARPGIVEETLQRARNLGLDIIDLIPTPVALYQALGTRAPAPSPTLFISIGSAGSEIAVGAKAGLLFARAFAGGGQMFTDAVAKAQRLSTTQAETLKTNEGSLLKGTPLAPVLQPPAELWATELQSCLAVYRSLFAGPAFAPGRVVLAGSGAELRGLAEFLSDKLGIPASLVDTLPGLRGPARPAAYATAAGLGAIGQLRTPPGLSLLPSTLHDELTFRRQKPYWIAAGVSAALILGVSLLGGYRDFRRKEHILRVQEASLSRRQKLVDEIEAVKARNDQILTMAKPLETMLEAGPRLRDLISWLAKSKAEGDSLLSISDADSYFSRRAAPPQGLGMRDHRRSIKPVEAGTSAAGLQRVVIEGFTRTTNLSTVKDLITRLAAADFVQSVDLLSDDKLIEDPTFTDSQSRQRFVIDLVLKTP